ncbi:GOLPH3/VPS74 family protein [Streptomyces caniscabiei]|uniref:GOLPH3/VPS74 family protein n=1 Tax=Streptomyces caniscabiei TaxID=2746961 RepID=UPI00187325CA|nr:GPP34 family phosphoprotein [Streptomyces caniscabiei]MBE4734852.1 GPP34 family phosphoprotein [Streptomyces caniscabiei]MBE4753986.1 GPP34 family phosphoprotein [Streptomyces caniscabiei]
MTMSIDSTAASAPVPTTLGEEILLLSLNDTTGEARLPLRTPYAIAAAALLERALSGAGVGGVDAAAGVDGAGEGEALPEDVEKWIHEHSTAEYETALRGVLKKGLIREEKRRVLLVFRTTRYPEADGTAESALRGRLAEVVLEGADPDPRTAALISLLHHGDLHTLVFPDADSEDSPARRRMAQIADHHWADPALRRMAETAAATAAALTAATMAMTVVVITSIT